MTADGSEQSALYRHGLARSFGQAAGAYERFRPDYPEAAVAAAVGGAHRVLDLGAGTGKLTGLLPTAGAHRIWAVEPDEQMRAVLATSCPDVSALAGTAEQIPLPDGTVDVVVVGQALHWFDLDAALPEIARVLEPGGRLVCLWNTFDTRDAFTAEWVGALDATVRPHGGATDRSADGDPGRPFADRPHFHDPALQLFDWNHRMPPADLHPLAATFSYVLTAEPSTREALHRRLDELIGTRSEVSIAQRCQVWSAVRR